MKQMPVTKKHRTGGKMEQKPIFESLLDKHRIVVERYIHFRMPSSQDAEDVIQETYYAAYHNFSTLQNHDLFKVWLLAIAKNQCNIWYRKKYGVEYLPLEVISDVAQVEEENAYDDVVWSILNQLPTETAQLLKLTMQGYKQREIAKQLGIPLGTVKSRFYFAKKRFYSLCTPEQIVIFERGRKKMGKIDYTCGFPMQMPKIVIQESTRPFMEIKFEEDAFIIPRVGNKNAEGIYRYPDKKLALVSTCHVPKAASVHDAIGVKVCRDIYNVKSKKFYKNEAVWFMQLTDEYVRDLGTILCDSEADDAVPTAIVTFLEDEYDVMVNGKDRVHGRPLLIKENPPKIENGKIYVEEYHAKYTMGSFDVTIGERTFETILFIRMQNDAMVTENYVDKYGRLVLMRSYEVIENLEQNESDSENLRKQTDNIPRLFINDTVYWLVEDSISQYAL